MSLDYYLVDSAEFEKLGSNRVFEIADEEGVDGVPCFEFYEEDWDGSDLVITAFESALTDALPNLTQEAAKAVKETIGQLLSPDCDDLGLACEEWLGSFNAKSVQRMWDTVQKLDLGTLAEAMKTSASRETKQLLAAFDVNIKDQLQMCVQLLQTASGKGSGLICMTG